MPIPVFAGYGFHRLFAKDSPVSYCPISPLVGTVLAFAMEGPTDPELLPALVRGSERAEGIAPQCRKWS